MREYFKLKNTQKEFFIAYFYEKIKIKNNSRSDFELKECSRKDLIWIRYKDILEIKFCGFHHFLFFCITGDAIWFTKDQFEKFDKRKNHGENVIPLNFFWYYNFYSKKYSKVWDNRLYIKPYSLYGNKLSKLKSKVLTDFSMRLNNLNLYIIKNKIEDKLFYYINKICNQLSLSFYSYAIYNKKCLSRIKKNHCRNHYRDYNKYYEIRIIEPSINFRFGDKFDCLYFKLLKTMRSMKEYEPKEISVFLPHNKKERINFIKKLKFPFPVEILQFLPGSNIKKIIFIWKIPVDGGKRINKSSINNIREKKKSIPLFASRAMAKKKKNN